MSKHDRFAYVLLGGEWVPKQRAQTDGGEQSDG
jgi:hypothetical protein